MIDNVLAIKKIGIEKFVRREQLRWKCSRCGELVSVHRPACLQCGKIKTAAQNGVS
jgi:uncharacterized OB-fold protein